MKQRQILLKNPTKKYAIKSELDSINQNDVLSFAENPTEFGLSQIKTDVCVFINKFTLLYGSMLIILNYEFKFRQYKRIQG